VDIAEAKGRALDLIAYGRTKSEAIVRVAFEMSASMGEYEEIKAALEQMELDPDKEIAALLKRLPESTESDEDLWWKTVRFDVESLIGAGLRRKEAIERVCRDLTDTPEEFKKMKATLVAMLSERTGEAP
jgi:hypothetical protein